MSPPPPPLLLPRNNRLVNSRSPSPTGSDTPITQHLGRPLTVDPGLSINTPKRYLRLFITESLYPTGIEMSSRIQTLSGNQVTTDSTHGVLKLLAGYDLHTTGEHEPDQSLHNAENPINADQDESQTTRQNDITQQPAQSPDWWPSNYNRMPPRRPVNYNLDRSQRPAGNSTFEWFFINGMLSGVCAVSGTSKLWRATAGRVAPKLFHYEIGGQW